MFSDPSTHNLILFAYLEKGGYIVMGAKVEVQVGKSPWREMNDDGVGKLNVS